MRSFRLSSIGSSHILLIEFLIRRNRMKVGDGVIEETYLSLLGEVSFAKSDEESYAARHA